MKTTKYQYSPNSTIFVLLFITIRSDMKTAQKIVNNLINENIFPLKVSSLRQDE